MVKMPVCCLNKKESTMTSNLIEKTFDTTYNILESNSTFLSRGSRDKKLYYCPPHILEAVVWLILNVSLPILLGIASSFFYEKIRNNRSSKEMEALSKTNEELEKLRYDLNQLLSIVSDRKSVTPEQLNILHIDIVEILKVNGWPEKDANIDGHEILQQLIAATHIYSSEDK